MQCLNKLETEPRSAACMKTPFGLHYIPWSLEENNLVTKMPDLL